MGFILYDLIARRIQTFQDSKSISTHRETMSDGAEQPKEELHLDANEAERTQAAPTEQKDAAPAQGAGEGGGAGGGSGTLQALTMPRLHLLLSPRTR